MLFLTPHTITIEPVVQNVATNHTANAITYGTSYTVLGMIEPVSSSADWMNFGLQTVQKYNMLLNLSDATTINVRDRVTCNNVVYVVSAQPKLYNVGFITDHAEIELEAA